MRRHPAAGSSEALTAERVRLLARLFEHAGNAVERALEASGEAGDSPARAGLVLTRLFALGRELGAGLPDLLERDVQRLDSTMPILGSATLLEKARSRLDLLNGKVAAEIVERFDLRKGRSEDAFWGAGVAGMLALARWSRRAAEAQVFKDEAALHASRALEVLTAPGQSARETGHVVESILDAYRAAGVGLDARPAIETALARLRLSRLEFDPERELAYFDLALERAEMLGAANDLDVDRAAKITSSLQSMAAARDEFLRRWPYDPRQPPAAAADGAVRKALAYEKDALEWLSNANGRIGQLADRIGVPPPSPAR